MTEENNPAAYEEGAQFSILSIYLKDASFEIPNAPQVFKEKWNPEINLQLNVEVSTVDTDLYEVVLNITVTAKQDGKTGFLVEIQQAGIFKVKGYKNEAKSNATLGAFCPKTLFPFARETISNLVVKGGFQPLLLSPINFDALYAQNINQKNSSVGDIVTN